MLTGEQLNTLLNSWREGTVGYAQDTEAIAALDEIGKRIGYGFMEQLAHWLYQAQCHGKTDEAAELKRERFQALGWPLPETFEHVARGVGCEPSAPSRSLRVCHTASLFWHSSESGRAGGRPFLRRVSMAFIDSLFKFKVGDWVRPVATPASVPMKIIYRRLEECYAGAQQNSYCIRGMKDGGFCNEGVWFTEPELEACESPSLMRTGRDGLAWAKDQFLKAPHNFKDAQAVRNIIDAVDEILNRQE